MFTGVVDRHESSVIFPKYSIRRKVRTVRTLAVLHIINGFIVTGIGVTILVTLDRRAFINASGVAVWAGLAVLITGIIGCVATLPYERKKYIISVIFFNGVTVIVSTVATILSALGLRYYVICRATYSFEKKHVIRLFFPTYCRQGHNVGPPLYAIALILFAGEILISVTSAFYSLKILRHVCRLHRSLVHDFRLQSRPFAHLAGYNDSHLLLAPEYITQPDANNELPSRFSHQTQICINSGGQRFMLIPLPDEYVPESHVHTPPYTRVGLSPENVSPPEYSEFDIQSTTSMLSSTNSRSCGGENPYILPPSYSP